MRKVAQSMGVSHQTAHNIATRNQGATSEEETQEQIETLLTLIGALMDRVPGASDRNLPAISGRIAKLQAEVRQLRMATRASGDEPNAVADAGSAIRARLERMAAAGVAAEPVSAPTASLEATDGAVAG